MKFCTFGLQSSDQLQDHVSPICLPFGARFPDTVDKDSDDVSKKVFVAGWGSLNDAKCTTDSKGPEANRELAMGPNGT